jgi:hypothetical protein
MSPPSGVAKETCSTTPAMGVIKKVKTIARRIGIFKSVASILRSDNLRRARVLWAYMENRGLSPQKVFLSKAAMGHFVPNPLPALAAGHPASGLRESWCPPQGAALAVASGPWQFCRSWRCQDVERCCCCRRTCGAGVSLGPGYDDGPILGRVTASLMGGKRHET